MRSKRRTAIAALVAMFAVGAVSAAPALASGKPLVETKAATSITANEAKLEGTVNPNGAETTYYFEYGTTTSYGSKTTEVTVPSGTANVEVNAVIAGLTVNTKYHFRLVATNSFGTTDGADETLSTSATGKPFVATGYANKHSESGVTLHGIVNPNGAETKYYFEYGTSESYGSKTAEISAGAGTSNVEVSRILTGLTAKTKYHFRLVATNASGTTDGADGLFLTAATAAEPEFKPVPTKKKLTGTAGTSGWTFGGNSIECTKTATTGEVDNSQTVGNVVVVFSGCTTSGIGGSGCVANSTGAKPGDIVTRPLTGELGKVATAEASSGVGLRFKPESKNKWFTLQVNDCTPEETFTGELTAEVSVIGKKQATNKLVFESGVSGAKIKEITLNSGVAERPEFEAFGALVAIGSTEEVKFEEALEVT
jgi:hypothetical protein